MDSTQGLLAQQLSQLIALIYQTASDAGSWEVLLERLSDSAETQSLTSGKVADQVLMPHFEQADRLIGDSPLSEQGLDLLEQTLNRLLMAVAIVDFQGKLLIHNKAMVDLLLSHGVSFCGWT